MFTFMTMNDPRWDKLAEIFCRSTKIKRGDKVLIEAIDLDALPLLYAIYRRAIELEAISVDYIVSLTDLERHLLQYGTVEQLNFSTKWELVRMKEIDVYMVIRARMNGLVFTDISPEALKAHRLAGKEVIDERVNHTRWCLTRVPTDFDASSAGMSTQEYLEYYFNAVFQDYELMEKRNNALKALMEKTDYVRIKAPGTNLGFSIKGIPAVSCHGDLNIPDGEVFTAPVWNSMNGVIHYNVDAIYDGHIYSKVFFTIKDGKITKAGCDQGEDAINALLDIDEGGRYFGEFAIGTNRGIPRPARNTLFDEKIFASLHLTPGQCYSNANNGNNSAIHLDLVRILSSEYGGGTIWFDDVPVIINGEFVHPDLQILFALNMTKL